MAKSSNGNGEMTKIHLDWRDRLGALATLIAILSALITAAFFVFQGRAQAIQEHAEIEKTQAVSEALAEQRAKQQHDTAKAVRVNTKTLYSLDKNIDIIMNELDVPRRRRAAAPVELEDYIE